MRTLLPLGIVLVLLGAPYRAAEATPSSSPYGLREAIIAYLEERAPLPTRSIEVPPLLDFFVPGLSKADVDIEVRSHPKAPRLGRVPVTVTLIASGRILRRGVVNARVHADVPVVVAAAPVQRGQLIQPEDLKLEDRDVSDLGSAWLDDPTALIGKRARRRVVPGALWQLSWAEIPPLVKRGELVRLRLAHGRLLIEGKGVVRKDAREGEWVRVVNADSRRELLGRVEADGAIHVEF
ncbi:MAG: flagellar basal body P-ring formation protein FlgA [bacterium]|nr:flagellar basal body P-ring formation protein FlgA [bacterium]MCP5067377.1 flagellar basal body P-ring formation protein FlgA [bacterium]